MRGVEEDAVPSSTTAAEEEVPAAPCRAMTAGLINQSLGWRSCARTEESAAEHEAVVWTTDEELLPVGGTREGAMVLSDDDDATEDSEDEADAVEFHRAPVILQSSKKVARGWRGTKR